jgi:hypothetical protein
MELAMGMALNYGLYSVWDWIGGNNINSFLHAKRSMLFKLLETHKEFYV